MTESDAYGTRQNRLPTLMEVLNRQTQPPVDLFSFYIYMRDQQRSVDYLDFWLDVSQHMSLCRHFVREMRRSVLLETPELEKAGSKRSSQILEQFDLRDGERGENGSIHSVRTQDQRVSQILRERGDSGSQKNLYKQSSNSLKDSPTHDDESPNSNGSPEGKGESPGRPSFMSSNLGIGGRDSSSPNDSTPHQHTVTRAHLRESATKILYTFLLPGAERQIILPGGMVEDIEEAIEMHGRDDPEVFDAAKDYVFQAMERDAFPGFLRSKALGNLIPVSLMVRLILGLLAVFGGLWAAFVLVFTDRSRAIRCWIILPMLIGIYLLASHQYTVDPILAFAGYSEYTWLNFNKVKEPFVRKLLIRRAIMLSVIILIITTAVCCLFIFVPGTRL